MAQPISQSFVQKFSYGRRSLNLVIEIFPPKIFENLFLKIKPQHETETRIYETRDPIGPFARRVSFTISAL